LREYVNSQVNALDRHMTAELASLRRETKAAEESATKAIDIAAHEAAERLLAHNGLIEQMRQQANTFATREAVDGFVASVRDAIDAQSKSNRESLAAYTKATDGRLAKIDRFQATLTGGIILASAIGIVNLVNQYG